LGTFKVKGGAGAYFHGGASLQEQILPLVHLSRKVAKAPKGASATLAIGFTKKAITNRFFSVTLALSADEMFAPEPKLVRIELSAGREPAGHAAMASYGFEEGTREITVKAGEPNSVTLMLTADSPPAHLTIRVIDSKTDALLASLKEIPVNLSH
jgi:hypothetical protein